MIRYTLRCPSDHQFDSWFHSAAAYDALSEAAQLACPDCGDRRIQKAVMAPRVATGRAPGRSRPTPMQIAAFRKMIEASSEDVGRRFAVHARAMHLGDETNRAIRGQATAEEARSLLEDGIAILPLPGVPKTN